MQIVFKMIVFKCFDIAKKNWISERLTHKKIVYLSFVYY